MEVDDEYKWMEEAGYKPVDGPVVIKYNKLSLIKKSIKTKRTKNRDQKRPTHDAYTHPDEHLRALVLATNQKKRAYR